MISVRSAQHLKGEELCYVYYRHWHIGSFIIWTKTVRKGW